MRARWAGIFERIIIEEDGTVVGHLTGPYRQLLSPDLVVPATTKTTSNEPDSPDTEPAELQLIPFDPSAWHHGVPARLAQHRTWRQHTKRRQPPRRVRPRARIGRFLVPGV
jgi:hypothetical protein